MRIEIWRHNWCYQFDQNKRDEVLAARGVDFEEALEIFDTAYFQDESALYENQSRAIGFSRGQLVTLVIEERDDGPNPYTWIVNAWKSTPAERNKYAKYHRG
jgi:uncharacterized DUF497 family protein